MTNLYPGAFLRVYDSDAEAFGKVLYCGDSLTWDVAGLLGTPGASYQGFQKDPTGTYLMQQIVPIPQPADPSQWTNGDGTALDGAQFYYGTDAATRCKYLYAAPTGPFNALFVPARVLDEGFLAEFYIGAYTAPPTGTVPAVAPVNFYIDFSRGRPLNDDGTFQPGLRLAFEPGSNIRLQVSLDGDATWTDVASADSLGDCEDYLKQNGRYITVSVLPMTDVSWYNNLPVSLSQGGQPPNQIVVSLGSGDAVLTYTAEGLAAGNLAVTGQNRQWSCLPYQMRFGITGSIILAPQVRPAEFQTEPQVFLNGYLPVDSGVSGDIVPDSPNSAHVEMTLAATPDETGYALHSCFLSSVDAEFPPLQIRPSNNPSYVDYPLVYSRVDHSYDQTAGVVRHRAEVWLTNQNDEFAPGVFVSLGVRAASLFHTIDGENFATEMTGWTGMEDGGQEWIEDGFLRFFKVTLSDRLVHTEEDTATCCGFQLPYDFQCHYYAFAQQAYRLGFTDDWFGFPLVQRGDATPYYYLDGGTTRNPVHQFPPDQTIGQAMQHLRAAAAEYDPITQKPVPMVYGTDPGGNLLYFGLPTGVVDLLSDPTLTLSQIGLDSLLTLSAVPSFSEDGTANLNEFVQGWSSRTSLRRVRTPVVLVGVDPQTGSTVYGVAYNEKVGGGPYADPNAPGYIGVDKPLYILSRLYSSQAVAQLSAQNASVQLAAPAIDTGGTIHLRPGLMPLTILDVNDYTSQGTTDSVGYYLTHVSGIVDQRDPLHFHEATLLSGRILGLSA